jgi:hypothetical protein
MEAELYDELADIVPKSGFVAPCDANAAKLRRRPLLLEVVSNIARRTTRKIR